MRHKKTSVQICIHICIYIYTYVRMRIYICINRSTCCITCHMGSSQDCLAEKNKRGNLPERVQKHHQSHLVSRHWVFFARPFSKQKLHPKGSGRLLTSKTLWKSFRRCAPSPEPYSAMSWTPWWSTGFFWRSLDSHPLTQTQE